MYSTNFTEDTYHLGSWMRLLCDWDGGTAKSEEKSGRARRARARAAAGAGAPASRAAGPPAGYLVPVRTGGAGPRAREDAAARPRGRFRLAALSRNVDIHRHCERERVDREGMTS